MASRTLVDLVNYDETQLHLAFQSVDGQVYLLFGDLDERALGYLLIFDADDRIGFMQRGVLQEHVGVAGEYDEVLGLPLDERPAVSVGQRYRVWSTRRRPDGLTYSSELDDPVSAFPFTFTFDDADLESDVFEETAAVMQTVRWRQGVPAIPNFSATDISLMFYEDADDTVALSPMDMAFRVGIMDHDSSPQELDDVVRLGAFVDNGDGTGTVQVILDVSLVDIMGREQIYFELQVNQPDA